MLRKRALQDQVVELLDNLGLDVNDVAATLIEAGAQGVPKDAESCVIAAYLHAVLGAERGVRWSKKFQPGLTSGSALVATAGVGRPSAAREEFHSCL